MKRTKTKRMASRSRKARVHPWRKFVAPLAAVLICAGAYVFLMTDIFTVEKVQFIGARELPIDSLHAATAGIIGHNLFTLPLARIREHLRERFPEIKEITFRKRPLHRLDCYLRQREPVAILAAETIHEIDEDGVVIPQKGRGSDIDLPVITGITDKELGEKEGKRKLRKALDVLELLKMFNFSPADQLSEIHMENDEIILVLLGTGTLVRMGEEGYLEKVQKLRVVYPTLEEQPHFPDVIDLRFDKQVVVR